MLIDPFTNFSVADFRFDMSAGGTLKERNIPLVRGGELTREMIDWIERVSEHFPGVEKDLVVIRKTCPAKSCEWDKAFQEREIGKIK